jgi:uncharacterized damage-inducible protein DinB
MSLTESFLREFENEAATTRRVLERVPEDRLTWKPHPKSMSIGTLALHVAMAPGYITEWALKDSIEWSGPDGRLEPKTKAEVLAAHDESVKKTKAALTALGDAGLQRDWRMTNKDGATIMGMPKTALVRSIAFNHVYHHRGQLSVYLRMLDVPVPSIYGPSADESPARA